MAQKQFTYRGKTLDELQKMDVKEFAQLLDARRRRSLQRTLLQRHAPLLKKIKRACAGQFKKPIKTHARNMIVLPEMVGLMIHVHKGNKFEPIMIVDEMIGHFLGELLLTRQKVAHSAPGIGATRSSTSAAGQPK